MARRAFYSFQYIPDNWRASQIRNMGIIEGNRPATDNEWEEVKKGGDKAIKKWIDDQFYGKSVAIVLIGSDTAGRKWINYEIQKAWDDKKGVLGIYIHNLKDSAGNQSSKGKNPFDVFTIGDRKMSSIVKAYDPPYSVSNSVYDHIKKNLSIWIEESISIREIY
ncbi:MAG: TIR domain-containing protein [Leptospiraceae bacterium]|nr:TIR domain-containing protein [Leptospiraceae bacterium]